MFAITATITLLTSLIILIRLYYKKKFSYWQTRGIPILTPPPSIPFGNLPNQFSTSRENMVRLFSQFYKQIKANNWKDCGIYFMASPNYMPLDLDYIKQILTKDFHYFVDRGIEGNEDEPLTENLFQIGGHKWKTLRAKLTPTFTSGKLKSMFAIFIECGEALSVAVSRESDKAINIKKVLGCFTTDIIGSCAFGLDCGSFQEENSPFRTNAAKFFTPTPLLNLSRAVFINAPSVAKKLGLKFIPREVSEFFINVVKETVALRHEKNLKRNDFFQLLLDMHAAEELTTDEVAAQAFLFFLAGFETSSSTMTFALYELAKHQEIQDRVREEIKTVLKKNETEEITYESLSELKYLEKVINETLRKYPPVPFVSRKCVQDYKHPLKENQDFVIEKGTRVIIPIYGIHHDAEYYPDPEKFDPERFSEEVKQSRHQYAFLPFGEGPRMCIGLRFGMLQVKVGLVTLLRQYRFRVNCRTQEPIAFSKKSIVLSAEGDIWLDAQQLDHSVDNN